MFKKLWHILLKTCHLLLDVCNVFINNFQGSSVVMPVLNLYLHKKFPVLAL